MAPILGSIEKYNTSEPFDAYIQRLNSFFVANDIGQYAATADAAVKAAAETKKAAVLISVIGKDAYQVLVNLCSPTLPATYTYEQLVTKLKSHYVPVKLQIAESFKFRKCVQQEGQSVAEYVALLREAASHCDYGDFLERMLKEQLTIGLLNKETQKKLLAKEHSLEDSIKQATADEAALKESVGISPGTGSSGSRTDIHYMKSGKNSHKQYKSGKSHNHTKKKHHTNCHSCGGDHDRTSCKFRDAVCHNCSRKGHIAKACLSKTHKSVSNTNAVSTSTTKPCDFDNGNSSYDLFVVNETLARDPVCVDMNIQGMNMTFQVDTGAALTIVPLQLFEKIYVSKPLPHLRDTDITFQTFTGHKFKPLGQCNVKIIYNSIHYFLPVTVVTEGEVALLGRDWLSVIKLDWQKLIPINRVSASSDNTADPLFSDTLGTYTGDPVKLHVVEEPKFFRARQVAYSQVDKVTAAIRKMTDEGILKKVQTSSCAAPIVPVEKKNGEIRVCGDFRCTFNQCAEPVKYPIPKVEDLHATLRGCTVFSTLDMSQAYHQVPVHPDSQKYLTINTHLGLYCFTRIPNGIHSAPGIFQEIMDKTIAGIPHVIAYLDDILIAGSNKEEHDKNLSQVFTRLRDSGFRLNRQKCTLHQTSVTFLGHTIDAEGLHPTHDKLKSINDAPIPTDAKQLKSFLGLIMFYSRFLPNHSTVLAPLNKLLCKDIPWKWTNTHTEAFQNAKKLLIESQTLVHYDDKLPLFMSCDASSYGAGGALFHKIDGIDRPVAFTSCSLSAAQKSYSQLDKEAFSIIFCLKKFHQFIYGRKFTIITDHRPLLHILGETKPVPSHTAARLQRYSLILASYDYTLTFRPTEKHIDADAMSRLPLATQYDPPSEYSSCNYFSTTTSVTADAIRKATERDVILSKVLLYTRHGWPTNHADSEAPSLQPYKSRKDELSTEQGVLLWGRRVIIPTALQQQVLNELHVTHSGMTRTKALARSYVWWPNLDAQIEETVKNCDVCQTLRNNPAKAPYHPWTYPCRPWERCHIDFAQYDGKTFLVLVDAYSKYPEVVKMNSITSTSTICALNTIFSRHGLPETLVSDNGTQFVSTEFKAYCKTNGIIHITSAVYKPATNGQCERVVQILKSGLKRAKADQATNLDDILQSMLLRYRITPHSTTGECPSMLLMGRVLRTKLDLLRPTVTAHVQNKQSVLLNKASKPVRAFNVGDSVLTRVYTVKGNDWHPGVVEKVLGYRHYLVRVGDNKFKRHIDQLLQYKTTNSVVHDHPNTQNTPNNSTDKSVLPMQRPKRTCGKPKYLDDYEV